MVMIKIHQSSESIQTSIIFLIFLNSETEVALKIMSLKDIISKKILDQSAKLECVQDTH